MKIGIIGVGNIGKTLVQKLSAAGHEVKAANSRGPETIDPDVFANGGRAVTLAEAVDNAEVVILSVPPTSFSKLAPVIGSLLPQTIVVDTFNYYPKRDDRIEELDAGQVESLWSAEQLGRPVVKAWNSLISDSFAKKGVPAGSPNRIALPVAGEHDRDRRLVMALVEETGFDAFDAGPLADSWRQQPGTPAYCTDLTLAELPGALAAADKSRSAKRRDIIWEAVVERMNGGTAYPDADYLVRLNRTICM